MSIDQGVPAGELSPPVVLFDSWWPGLEETSSPPGWEPVGALGDVEALAARARARSQGLAQFLTALHTIGHPGGQMRGEFAVDEVANTLGWSHTMAGQWLVLADDVIDRLPALHAALEEGRLDEAKVRAFVEWTRDMPDDLARLVTAQVLPAAPGLGKRDLIDLIGSTATALDPDWARRREQAARTRVRVEAVRNPQGTGDIWVRDLGAGATVTIKARVDALAGPLRDAGRRLGLPVGVALARGFAAERILDGSCAGLDDDEVLAVLVEQLPAYLADIMNPDGGPGGPAGPDGPDGGPDGPDGGSGGPDGGPDDSDDGPDGPDGGSDGPDGGPDGPDGGIGGDEGEAEKTGAGSEEAEPGRAGADEAGADEAGADEAGADEAGADEAGADEAGADPDKANAAGPGDGSERLVGGVRAGTTELRLRLSTALGLDELPGEVPTWGIVTAPTARDLLLRARAGDSPGECRLVLTDQHGHLEHVFLIRSDPPPRPRRRADPAGSAEARSPEASSPETQPTVPDRPAGPRRHDQRRGRIPGRVRSQAIVELAAPTTMLADLDPDQHREWAVLIRRAQHRLAGIADRDAQPGGAAHPATTTADAHRRHPGRELDRWIRVRDRHCLGLMCTRPAHSTDLDHTRDWIDGGLTVAANLGGLCRHCHRLKHEGGWRLDQPDPGTFVWRTHAGATYTVHPRPVLDLDPPDPAPRSDGRPRPVLDVDPPPDDRDTGWIDLGPRTAVARGAARGVATPPPRSARSHYPDEPSF